MAINYDELSTANRNQVIDLITKREAVDSALADLQTERATRETVRVTKEQELEAGEKLNYRNNTKDEEGNSNVR